MPRPRRKRQRRISPPTPPTPPTQPTPPTPSTPPTLATPLTPPTLPNPPTLPTPPTLRTPSSDDTVSMSPPSSGSEKGLRRGEVYEHDAAQNEPDGVVRRAMYKKWASKKVRAICIDTGSGEELYCWKWVLAAASLPGNSILVDMRRGVERIAVPMRPSGLALALEMLFCGMTGKQPELYAHEQDFALAIKFCRNYKIRPILWKFVVNQALRYLAPNNPFIAYALHVHELRVRDAWKDMIVTLHIHGDFPLWTRQFLKSVYPAYLAGYMQCRQQLLVRLERFLVSFQSGDFPGWSRFENVLCGMMITIDRICPVYRQYSGSFWQAFRDVANEFTKVYMTGKYCQLAMLKPQVLKFLNCSRCRHRFGRRIDQAIRHLDEPLFGLEMLVAR